MPNGTCARMASSPPPIMPTRPLRSSPWASRRHWSLRCTRWGSCRQSCDGCRRASPHGRTWTTSETRRPTRKRSTCVHRARSYLYRCRLCARHRRRGTQTTVTRSGIRTVRRGPAPTCPVRQVKLLFLRRHCSLIARVPLVARAAWPCYHVRDQFLNVHARGILGLLCQLEYSCILLNDRATYIHSTIPWWTAYVRRDLVCHDRHVICSARFVSVIRCTITACIRDTRIVNAVILTTPDSAVRFASAGDGLQLRGRSGADLSVRARKLP